MCSCLSSRGWPRRATPTNTPRAILDVNVFVGAALCGRPTRLGGEALYGLFDHQPAAADRGHVKGNYAAAAIAVGVVAHHALTFLLSGWTKRKSL